MLSHSEPRELTGSRLPCRRLKASGFRICSNNEGSEGFLFMSTNLGAGGVSVSGSYYLNLRFNVTNSISCISYDAL